MLGYRVNLLPPFLRMPCNARLLSLYGLSLYGHHESRVLARSSLAPPPLPWCISFPARFTNMRFTVNDGAGLIFDYAMTEFGPNLGFVSYYCRFWCFSPQIKPRGDCRSWKTFARSRHGVIKNLRFCRGGARVGGAHAYIGASRRCSVHHPFSI